MKNFLSSQEYENFLNDFKISYDLSPSKAKTKYKNYLVNEMGLNENQAINVIPHLVDSIKDIRRTMIFKAMLVGSFSLGSSKGTIGFGYSSGYAAEHILGEAFTYVYNDLQRSSYCSPLSSYSSFSYSTEPSRSSASGIYFLGKLKDDIRSPWITVIVCFNDGSYKDYIADLNFSKRHFWEK